MPRTPSDDARDAARDAKIKQQGGTDQGWKAPTSKPKSNRPVVPGFKIDWDEKHHLNPVDMYARFTQGMSAEQIAQVDAALAGKGVRYKGNKGLNRIDLPKRHHNQSSPFYSGAHQVTQGLGIDSRERRNQLDSMSVDQRMGILDEFTTQMATHKRIGQSKYFEQFQLEPGNNAEANPYGGNFSQQILRPDNKGNTKKQADANRKARALEITTTNNLSQPTTAPQGRAPSTPQTTATPQRNPIKPPQTSGGYQGRSRTISETPPITPAPPPPQSTNWGQNALTILGSAAAVGGQVLKSLFIDPLAMP